MCQSSSNAVIMTIFVSGFIARISIIRWTPSISGIRTSDRMRKNEDGFSLNLCKAFTGSSKG